MRELNFSSHNLSVDLLEVKKMFSEDLNDGCRYLIKQAFEKIMRYEVNSYLKTEPYERASDRQSYRNGYRKRSLLTNAGLMELEVPRTRDGRYVPSVFERYKRVHDIVDRGIKEMFLKGVSTRKVGDVLNALCGAGVSPGYVSQVTKQLDKEVKLFMNEPIDDEYAFLFLDALSMRIRYELKAKRRMVTCSLRSTKGRQQAFIEF